MSDESREANLEMERESPGGAARWRQCERGADQPAADLVPTGAVCVSSTPEGGPGVLGPREWHTLCHHLPLGRDLPDGGQALSQD